MTRELQFADVTFWASIAILIFNSLNGLLEHAYFLSGLSLAVVSGLVVSKVAMTKLSAHHDIQTQSALAVLDENLADAERARSDAEMAKLALESVQEHLANGGKIEVRGQTSGISGKRPH